MNWELPGFVLWVVVPVAVPVCFGYTLWVFLGASLVASVDALVPHRAGALDPRLPASGPRPGEPAQQAYWAGQMWRDGWDAARTGPRVVFHLLGRQWLHHTVKRLFLGRGPLSGQRGRGVFTRTVMRVVAPGTAVGAMAGAASAVLITSAVMCVFGAFLTAVWAGAAATAVVVRAVDRLQRAARGIRMKCPHPGCYRPIPLATHRCPRCRAPHGRLRPGRLGVLWHVCDCGERLATTGLGGRGRLVIQCPHCDQWLPETVGTTRVVHVPLIGGTSSGKTMLMAAMVAGLRSWSRRSPLTVEYASDADRRDLESIDQQVTSTGWAHKTQGGQPRAYMLRVGHGRRRRLLYLYDPMGESLRDAETVREQHYLAHADGLVLVADVLADPQVRRELGTDDMQRAQEARPSDQGPLDTYHWLVGELAELTGRRDRLPVAAVVTKRDVLDRIEGLPVPGAQVGSWLENIGLGSLVRSLGHDFADARYWAVSASTGTGTSGQDGELRRAAEPVLWLLARSGLRVGNLVTEPPAFPRQRRGRVRERSTR